MTQEELTAANAYTAAAGARYISPLASSAQDDAGHFVGERHSNQHRRFPRDHASDLRPCGSAMAGDLDQDICSLR